MKVIKKKNRKQKEYIVQMYTGGGGDLHVPANPPPQFNHGGWAKSDLANRYQTKNSNEMVEWTGTLMWPYMYKAWVFCFYG